MTTDRATKNLDNAIVLIGSPLIFIWDGWCVSVMWGWFLVPLGLRAIGVAQGFGISMLAILLRGRRRRKTVDEDTFDLLVKSFAFEGFVLGLGWIAHRLAS